MPTKVAIGDDAREPPGRIENADAAEPLAQSSTTAADMRASMPTRGTSAPLCITSRTSVSRAPSFPPVGFIRNELNQALKGFEVSHQQEIDDIMIALDGTENKGKFGANAMLAVSLAVAKAAALNKHLPLYQYLGGHSSCILPLPMMNIINGGAHADNNLDFQEFMILPVGAPTFSDALRAGTEVFHHLKQLLKAKNYNTNVGDEGGFAPDLPNQEAAVELILEAVLKAGYQPKKDICLGLDVASNELYRDGKYHLHGEKRVLSGDEFVDYLARYVDQYPIISIEDGMEENDWNGWQTLTKDWVTVFNWLVMIYS